MRTKKMPACQLSFIKYSRDESKLRSNDLKEMEMLKRDRVLQKNNNRSNINFTMQFKNRDFEAFKVIGFEGAFQSPKGLQI